jgi:hypothetical protein
MKRIISRLVDSLVRPVTTSIDLRRPLPHPLPQSFLEDGAKHHVLLSPDYNEHQPTYSHLDIAKVHFLLSSPSSPLRSRLPRLPPELIALILNHAEYWTSHSVSKNELFNGLNCNTCYLRTPIIRSHILHPVRKIVFEICSHDQGWSGELEKGTYWYSYTWFEAALVCPSEETGQWEEVEVSRCQVICNVQAKGEFTRHLIEFESGHRMVRQMQNGQAVSLWVRAQYPAWRNTVSDACCTVFLDS